jgi:hypothetical protein
LSAQGLKAPVDLFLRYPIGRAAGWATNQCHNRSTLALLPLQ